MCDPLTMTAASIGMSAVEAGMQYAGQQSYASQETAALNANLRNQYTQGQEQRIWQDNAAEQKLEDNQHALRAAQGKLTAAASENGVAGTSIMALSNELSANAGHYASDVEYNRTAQDEEISEEMQGFQNQTRSRLNQIPQPSLLGAAVDVGAAGLNAAGRFPQTAAPSNLGIPIEDKWALIDKRRSAVRRGSLCV